MDEHKHVYDRDLMCNPTVLQDIQFFLLACECGTVHGYGGAIVRPHEAAAYGHREPNGD